MQAVIAVTQYCERSGEGLWSEPFNALTNVAFVVAVALFVYPVLKTGRRLPWDSWLLVALAIATAVGSFLWHTLATSWSEWADVIPIALFINVYLFSFLLRIAGLTWQATLFLFAGFQLVNVAIQIVLPQDLFNGSIAYLPTLATLFVLAVYCRISGRRQSAWLMAMSMVFTVSLVLRTLDAGICNIFPLGTHFVWHLLNAAVLYMAMRSLAD